MLLFIFLIIQVPHTDFPYAQADNPRCVWRDYVEVYCDGVKVENVNEANVNEGWLVEVIKDENGLPIPIGNGLFQARIRRGTIQILFISPQHKQEYLIRIGRIILASCP